ncbi:MAG: sulfotransferase [Mariprofundaceae bacterium]|nr:sulfotransferase [Mariprofundaceae bacterium]
MARSGSTLMCKCLGCMQGSALLSEIHPAATRMFNPLNQAQGWFSLLNKKDIARLENGQSMDFVEAIQLIERRCRQKNLNLVIRDWAHLDFTGLPFIETPAMSPALADTLQNHFSLIRIAMVRHPLDQWLSISHLELMQESIKSGKLNVQSFMTGYEAFARESAAIGFIRYEDFTRHPQRNMQTLCNMLELRFDPAFLEHWGDYQTITGDVQSTRGGNEITPLQRRSFNTSLMRQFEKEDSYHNSLALLGYSAEDWS